MKKELVIITGICRVIIVYRILPIQKAEIVNMVRAYNPGI